MIEFSHNNGKNHLPRDLTILTVGRSESVPGSYTCQPEPLPAWPHKKATQRRKKLGRLIVHAFDLRNKNLLRPTVDIVSYLLISVKLANGDIKPSNQFVLDNKPIAW
jgi:hypothetical protein